MGIREQVQAQLLQARRQKDEATLNVIGMIKNKVLMELKAGTGAEETDALWLEVVSAYAKQLRKSIPEFEKAGERGKEALADVEFELRFCDQFLPKKLDQAHTLALVTEIAQANGLAGAGAKATGKLMGLLMKDHKDALDGELTRAAVAQILGA